MRICLIKSLGCLFYFIFFDLRVPCAGYQHDFIFQECLRTRRSSYSLSSAPARDIGALGLQTEEIGQSRHSVVIDSLKERAEEIFSCRRFAGGSFSYYCGIPDRIPTYII